MTIANQKGGVGKTTSAVNLAAGLAQHGARVLVIDLDPQGNASTALDVDHHSGVGSIYNVLVEGQPLSAIVSRVEGFAHLYCAPATIDLAGAEIELVPQVAREARLSRALESCFDMLLALYDRGLAYLQSYWWLEAARSFNQALSLDPDLAVAQASLSIAYTELNAPGAAGESLYPQPGPRS